MVYVLSVELLVAACMVTGTVLTQQVTAVDWTTTGILLVCASAHLWFSRRNEESRRDGSPGPHVDTTVVWTFPAAVLLPVPLACLVTLWTLVQLYPVARRPLFRYVFSSAEVLLSVLVARAVTTGVFDWSGPDTTAGSAVQATPVLVAAAVYFLTEILAIGGVIALSTPKPTLAMMAGSRKDNLFAGLTLCLAVVLVLASVHSLVAPVLLVPLLCTGDWAIRQIERLRGDARTDHKTDLLNSRGWNEQAAREIARIRRQQGGKLSVAILDLDFFKQVNDTWGHPAGDAVLYTVGRVLNEQVREGDVIGRFGGEEFVLLFPDTDLASALVIAERVRVGIQKMDVAAADKRGEPVIIEGRTASIGVAAYDNGPGEPDIEVLLQHADAAVYEAKNGGRNQVRSALDVH